MVFKYKDTEIEYYPVDTDEDGYEHLDPEGIWVELISTKKDARGTGSARAALESFLLEKQDATVYLVICPKERGVSFSRLVEFYESCGFKEHESAAEMPYPLMVR